jgi:methyl-accepting chemotaxis protein
MQKLKSISGRLIASFAAVSVMCMAVGAYGIRNQDNSVRATESLTNTLFPKSQEVLELRRLSSEAYTSLLRLGLTGNMAKENEALTAKVLKVIDDFKSVVKGIKDLSPTAGETEHLEHALTQWTRIESKLREAVTLAQETTVAGREKFGRFYQEGFRQERTDLNQSVDQLLSFYAGQVNLTIQGSKATAQSSQRWTIIAVLIGTLSALAMGFWIARSLSSRLAGISSALGGESAGVHRSSQALAGVAVSLSESIKEESMALQQTASAAEEVAATAKKNEELASQAIRIATSSTECSKQGQRSVSDMISAMQEIQASNGQIRTQVEQGNRELAGIVSVISEIGNKTKVINDIVFQTKLLSFNASVEAARAGEHGKGFAVVAEEVGGLAQMSGAAAREISEILESGLEKVKGILSLTNSQVEKLVVDGHKKTDHGMETVRRCGTVLDEIASNVGQSATMAEQIAQSSREQSTGIQEINQSIAQIEMLTQKNLASSEATSSLSDTLRGNTEHLSELSCSLESTIHGREIATKVRDEVRPSPPAAAKLKLAA